MKTRSSLVYLPGYPIGVKELMPSHILAAIAGSLLDASHFTSIEDLGTLSTLDRVFDGKLSERAQHIVELTQPDRTANPLQSLYILWQIHAADKEFAAAMADVAREAAERVATTKGLHFAGLLAETPEDYVCALAVAERLRAIRPKLKLLAFGRFVNAFGEALIARACPFDAMCVGDFEASVLAFAEQLDAPETWPHLPDVLCKHEPPRARRRTSEAVSLGSLPAPVYDRGAYPALRDGQKIKLFEIEDSRAAPLGGEDDGRAVRMKPVAVVCGELGRLAASYGARLFHIRGARPPASHVSAIAHEILRRRMSVVYSREGHAESCVAATLPALKASGCTSLTFEVNTGSQRLHDRCYGTGLTITQIEQALRDARAAGLYTIATLTYPCPDDDYHTRAETLRLIDRTRPHAAPVTLPDWGHRASRFRIDTRIGYAVGGMKYLDGVLRRGLRFPLLWPWWRTLPREAGEHDAAEVLSAHRDLVYDLEGLGISTSVPDEVLRLTRLSGTGRVPDDAARLRRALAGGRLDEVAAFIDDFNAAAESRQAARDRQSEKDVRAVVGK